MKTVLIAAAALAVASGTANAAIPAFSVTCGKKTEVKAAAGGPIMVNGKEVKLATEKDNYYEVKKGKATYAVTVGTDNAVSVTFTNKKGEKGTCTAKTA
jgi:hypothetical protein